jgi:hypothetical protein
MSDLEEHVRDDVKRRIWTSIGAICVPAIVATIRDADDRTDDSAFGAMMLLPSGRSLKKRRFLMNGRQQNIAALAAELFCIVRTWPGVATTESRRSALQVSGR